MVIVCLRICGVARKNGKDVANGFYACYCKGNFGMQYVPNKLLLSSVSTLVVTGLISMLLLLITFAGKRQANGLITFDYAITEEADSLYLSASIQTVNAKALATSAMIEILVPNGTGIKVANAASVTINPNDATSGKLVWHGKLPKNTKIPANSSVKITTNVATVATTPLKYQAACRWSEMEAGWKGDWRRRFQDANTFDAIWTTAGQKPITAELTITRNGNQISISKKGASDGSNCEYSGVISNDGRTVKGTLTCKQGNGGREIEWTATIGANCQ